MEKIERISIIAKHYYARKDIQKGLVAQSANKEIIPRYFDNFGKRPDTVEYEQDIANLAAKGATSFHCSEELWSNPLELNTSSQQKQIDELRTGWDFLIDIDCNFLEYSKIAAWLLCEAFYFHGVRNFGLKFSGNTGFHIGLGFKAFPSIANNIEIKDFFPQGPRLIAAYLKEMITQGLRTRILDLSTLKEISQAVGKTPNDLKRKICNICGESASKRIHTKLECACGRIEEKIGRQDVQQLCPDCRKVMHKKSEIETFECQKCGNTKDFKTGKEFDPYSILELDTILISPRHLYRMAYSLHEKTALASIVIKPEQIKAFHPRWAKPEMVIPTRFMPEPEPNEARELLTQAIDWQAKKEEKKAIEEKIQGVIPKTKTDAGIRRGQTIQISKSQINEKIFPPCIKAALKGLQHDGRKRTLFILINFFRSLKLDFETIKKKLGEWNKLNYRPLRENYIATQLQWFKRQEPRLPPNCALNAYYQDMGICVPDFLCKKIKNPVNYAIIKAKIMKTMTKTQGDIAKRGKRKAGKKRKSFK